MANRHRAEVEREIGDKTYSFRLSFSALMHIEGDLGKPFIKWAEEDLKAGQLNLSDIFKLLHRALNGGGHNMTADEADILFNELDMEDATELITDLVGVAFPQSEGDDEPTGE